MDQPLDIPRLPLSGRRLIEASAGTGKTYTIAALYVRLVLGHGSEHGFARPLAPSEILVVTFTRAATEELRERIRARLREARDALLGRLPPDATLAALLAEYQGDVALAQARRLDQAVRMMDDAAIFTIHGFCQRMLKRHAFDSGTRFAVELTADGSALFEQGLEDYWRRHFYPLDSDAQALIQSYWEGPAALSEALAIPLGADVERRLLWRGKEGEALVEAPGSVLDALAPCRAGLARAADAAARVRAAFDSQALEALFEQALAEKVFAANRVSKASLAPRLDALRQWCAGHAPLLPQALLDDKGRAWLGAARLEAAAKKGCQPPGHALFDALDALAECQAGLVDARPALIAHALEVLERELAARKRSEGLLDFDDLLVELDQALAGPLGERLARSIRAELPVALIDEFQDTDARQYRIFERIYPGGIYPGGIYPGRPGPGALGAQGSEAMPHALLLIGDPKQAIYAFRNADVGTYLAARQRVEARYTLKRNFRSSVAMVEAVNRLFSLSSMPFRDPGIVFTPSEAQGRAERLAFGGETIAALTCWLPASDASVDRASYLRTMSEAVRADIQRLLEGAGAGRAGFVGEQGSLVPLRAADIAILVRTGTEALAVREALAHGGIKSVYLSQKASVFETQEAFWLLQLLEAVAQPKRDRALRAAIATRLLSDQLDEVARLIDDERHWESMVERFEDYHRDWRRVGVLAMIRRVMHDFDVGARLLARDDGERSLTDLLHLAELAQSASQVLDGEQALLRWLHRALSGRFERGLDPEALIQRLESDEELVRVVTIHKSKGLEYPLVYLPFPCDYRRLDRAQGPLVVDHPEYGRVVALAPDDGLVALADEARLAEDLRLLYVALTRARYACRVGIAPLYKGRRLRGDDDDATTLEHSALGTLLNDGAALGGRVLRERLEALADGRVIALSPPPEPPPHPLEARSEPLVPRQARRFGGEIARGWWISSYTALVEDARRGDGDEETPGIALLPAGLDLEVSDERTPVPAPPLGRINDFPRGPRAGTFLHTLLEALDFDRLAEPDYRIELDALVEHRLRRSAFDPGWRQPLQEWLGRLLGAPLDPELPGLRLDALGAWKAELEFWLPVAPTQAGHIDRLIRRFEPLGAEADYPTLAPRRLEGMLRGFIDLVFCFEGRWYLLDWKSNHLGDSGEAYREQGLLQAIVSHRYDVQYVLYALALHRHLRVRIEDYDYERHFGGVLYLFLRGVDAERTDQGVFRRRPSPVLIEALDRLLAGDASVEAPVGEIEDGG